MRGPPITIKCDCGELKHVEYGERWTCESCGRRWNTAQIPADEYYGILREMRRFRLNAIAAAVVIFAVFGVLAVFVSESLLLLAPILIAGWYLFYMPLWRRKVRRRARSLPNWQLRPE
jgi:Flp pilus assembly protein TadB